MLAPSPPQPSMFKRVMDAVLSPQPPAAKPYAQMGVSGTAVFGGYVQSREKSSQWLGQQRYVTISDMAVNTSIIAAGVHYFLNLIARPTWTITPRDEKSSEAEAAAEFVDECIQDLAQPWSRVVRRAGTYRFYGFGVQEWTAKKRVDGKVGLAFIEPRPQSTIARWSVADSGAVEGVWQVSPATGQELGIPRRKLLYLVDDVLSDSPEGVGIFRHLAEPWERLKQYYALEARAFERDLRGTPVGRVPYTLLREAVASGDLTKADAEALAETMEKFVKLQVKQSDTAITLDSIPYYSQAADGAKVAGLPQWGLELLQGGSAGMVEVAAAITRTQTEMARILTVEHLMMGESSGNRSLSEDKSRNLYLVANAVLQDIAAGVQQDVVPAICDLNGIPEEFYPRCEVEDVSSADADAVASVLAKMAQAGATLAPDDPVVDDVRQLLGVSESKPPSPEMMGLPAGGGGTAAADAAAVAKINENHDEQGRFASGTGGGGGASSGGEKLKGTGASKIPKGTLEEQISDNESEMEAIDSDASMAANTGNDKKADALTREYQAYEAINTVMRNDLKAKAKPEIAGSEKFIYAQQGDNVVAAIHYRQVNDAISIEWLGNVGPSGTGAKLLDHAEKDAAKIGAKEIQLKAKWGSEKFYERKGYKLTGDTNSLADWVEMSKPLGVGKAGLHPFDKENPNHDELGRFSSGDGGGGGAGGAGGGGIVPAVLRQPWAKGTTVNADGSVRTSNVNDAARALFEGRKVDLDQPRTVSVLIEKLGGITKNMAALGEEAPNFNLCNVSVAGSNLFCADNKGIPRIQMPQLDEQQTRDFRQYLKEKGYSVEKTKEKASFLRATQNELIGAKVARQAAKIEAAGVMDKRIVVSRDNYILDGHHHWAGQIAYDAKKNGNLGNLKTKISRVDISITDLLREADAFTGGKGKKGGGALKAARSTLDDEWDDSDWASDFEKENLNHDEQGRFAEGPGYASVRASVGEKMRARAAQARQWVESTVGREALSSAVDKAVAAAKNPENIKAALATAVVFTMYHSGIDLPGSVEEAVKEQIHNFADSAHIMRGQARDLMRSTVRGLIAMRQKQISGRLGKADEDDPVLEYLQEVLDALGAYEPDDVAKENPNHDELGRFAEGAGGGSGSGGVFSSNASGYDFADEGDHELLLDRTVSKPLSTAEESALEGYSGGDYLDMNKALRNGLDAPTGHLDAVFARAQLPENLTVYRQVDAVTLSSLKSAADKGGVVVDHGFVSTTVNKDHLPAGHRIEIELPAGTKAIPMGAISTYGTSEQEVLVNRGTSFVARMRGNVIVLRAKK